MQRKNAANYKKIIGIQQTHDLQLHGLSILLHGTYFLSPELEVNKDPSSVKVSQTSNIQTKKAYNILTKSTPMVLI
jgi:hypothetical protein